MERRRARTMEWLYLQYKKSVLGYFYSIYLQYTQSFCTIKNGGLFVVLCFFLLRKSNWIPMFRIDFELRNFDQNKVKII